MNNVYFVHQIKHNKTNDTWDKGIVVKADPEKDNQAEALQTYHSYLGAYGYGHDTNIDYVYCQLTSADGVREPLFETWSAPNT